LRMKREALPASPLTWESDSAHVSKGCPDRGTLLWSLMPIKVIVGGSTLRLIRIAARVWFRRV
jgi:hypothetical protein